MDMPNLSVPKMSFHICRPLFPLFSFISFDFLSLPILSYNMGCSRIIHLFSTLAQFSSSRCAKCVSNAYMFVEITSISSLLLPDVLSPFPTPSFVPSHPDSLRRPPPQLSLVCSPFQCSSNNPPFTHSLSVPFTRPGIRTAQRRSFPPKLRRVRQEI